ncbi:hypothetical protein [Mesorhizobium sp. M7A.F.Ca.ET.027.03.2.1]|uniref:hypothetical protein n=1 Tax=Mesorhizobium sp. M7A.F.Ca.ET.027.03.2.1 TaxID=2496656 RepID=UPI000FCA4703|nr:hypothetical protein [Mesorhizobium sp. M7A.F.Ca.ET.027.03.2.1]RVD64717.1 hypothetical protein EN750_11415 [Mesorhizobium sp. M7A.F.Ca.ET.027.03.2.1]
MTKTANSTANVKIPAQPVRKVPHEADTLSFMHRKPRDVGGVNYWNVEATGYFGKDCDKGHELAREYLDFIGRYPTNGNATLLGCIVNDMCRVRQEERKPSGNHLTGVEIGFLGEVNRYTMATMVAVVKMLGKSEGGDA